jgi:hypothetical protein
VALRLEVAPGNVKLMRCYCIYFEFQHSVLVLQPAALDASISEAGLYQYDHSPTLRKLASGSAPDYDWLMFCFRVDQQQQDVVQRVQDLRKALGKERLYGG